MVISAKSQIFWEKVWILDLKMFTGGTYPVCEGDALLSLFDEDNPYVSS
jgi:hypothetical protein